MRFLQFWKLLIGDRFYVSYGGHETKYLKVGQYLAKNLTNGRDEFFDEFRTVELA